LRNLPRLEKTRYFANSAEKEIGELTERLAEILANDASSKLYWHHEKMPEEAHSTIFHPAALKAFRAVFKPRAGD
jgi:uncharacterized protein